MPRKTKVKARRQKREARLKMLRQMLEQRAERREEEEQRIPLPPTLEGFFAYVWWPHVETKEPVNGLTFIGEDYLDNRTCFRWDDDGNRIAGSDIVMKPRRAFLTTLVWACIVYFLIRWDNLRSITAFQVGDQDEIIEPAIAKLSYMLERLPQYWLGKWRRKGNTIYLGKRWIGEEYGNDGIREGGQWTPISSGHTPEIADKRGRSADCDIFHASETCVIPYPEPLFSAVGKALPAATGIMISEGTLPNTKTQFHAAEYLATIEGDSMFLKAFFWRWFDQPYKRIPRGTADFDKFMSPEWAARLDPLELAREDELGLNDEQKAFRRKEFFTGSPEKRRRARRENPEDIMSAFESEGETHFDSDALDRAKRLTRPPVNDDRHVLGRHFGISIWDENHEGFLILGVDVAQKDGKDFTAVVALDGATLEQVAEIHGRCLASEGAEAIAYLLERLGKSRRSYIVVIESNHGKALIGECLNRKIRLYSEVAKAESRKKRKTVRRWGLTTQGYNRNKIIDCIGEGIEGPRLDENRLPRELGPIAPIHSEYLVDEIAHLVWDDKKNRVQAAAGHHDDLAIAYGLARFVAPRVRMPGRSRVASVEEQPQGGVILNRGRTARRRSRGELRGGGPM